MMFHATAVSRWCRTVASLSVWTLGGFAMSAMAHTADPAVCHAQLAQVMARNMPQTPAAQLPLRAVCDCTQALMKQEPADLSQEENRRRMEAHQATCLQPHVKAYTADHVTRQFSAHLQQARGWSAQQVGQLAVCMGERHGLYLMANPVGNPDLRDGLGDWNSCVAQAGHPGEPLPLLKAP